VAPASTTAAPAPTAKALASILAARLHAWSLDVSGVAVALSGGPDSLALAALLAQVHPQTIALIVDHGLRPESAAEARHAAVQAQALGLTTHILNWVGEKPATGILAAARQARYDLLLGFCRTHNINSLCLAHHANDQAETAQLRAQRHSGWRGLAGMPYLTRRGPVALVRPLLDCSKAQLIAVCDELGLAYVTDPSNLNPKYSRAQLRLSGVAPYDPAPARARQQEIGQLRALAGQLYTIDSVGGYAHLQPGWLTHELAAPLLRDLLVLIGQGAHPPAPAALTQALSWLQSGRTGLTLAGCRLRQHAQGQGGCLIAREPAAITPRLLPVGAHNIWWDQRWEIELRNVYEVELAPLGAGSWHHLPQTDWLHELPGMARAALPAVWHGGQVESVLKGKWQPNQQPWSQIFTID